MSFPELLFAYNLMQSELDAIVALSAVTLLDH